MAEQAARSEPTVDVAVTARLAHYENMLKSKDDTINELKVYSQKLLEAERFRTETLRKQLANILQTLMQDADDLKASADN